MKSDYVRVIVKEPGKDPYEKTIPNTLKAFQELVGGYIECVTFALDACIVCNEEGMLLGLPYNCSIFGKNFVGTILLVGYDSGGEFVDSPNSVKFAGYYIPLKDCFEENDRGDADE